MIAWAPSTGEARWGIYPISACDQWRPTGSNDSFYCNKTLDQMIDKAVASVSPQGAGRLPAKGSGKSWSRTPPLSTCLATKETVGVPEGPRHHQLALELVYADKDTWKEK